MRLYDRMTEACALVEQRRVADGEGGFRTEWVAGAEFEAAITRDTSTLARIAEKEGVANVYTVTTPAVRLSFHDVFRRLSDGQAFRVTSNSDDGETPPPVTFSFGQCTAEEWEVPDAD